MDTYTAAQIIRIGGREWRKGDLHRVYIHTEVWMDLVGLKIERYRSGRIARAWLRGEKISNNKAYALVAGAQKVYLDVRAGLLYIGAIAPTADSEEIAALIRAAVAERVAATEPAPAADEDDDQDAPSGDEGAAGIVARLRQAGRTVRQIAQMVGVSASTVYRWARGVCRPRPTNLAALTALA